jgi:mannosyl-3-phosphoglycerate phosphatase
MRRALRNADLRCSVGGRFDHVTGGTDKGAPVPILRRLYARLFGDVTMVGLGDSLNDRELLSAVDLPVVVRNTANASSDRLLREVPGATATIGEGPAGWREAIDRILDARTAVEDAVPATQGGSRGRPAGRGPGTR